MDSLTHALTAAVLAYVLGIPELMPFLVLGAVIIDADILFSRVSDSNPRLYLFTHGGMAHSIGGAVGIGAIAPFQPFQDSPKLAVQHGVDFAPLGAGCQNDALDKRA